MNRKPPEMPHTVTKKKTRRKLLMESIEDRILCSATMAVAPEAPVDPVAAGIAVAPVTAVSAPADPAPSQVQPATVAAPVPAPVAAANAGATQLTDAQRQALESIVRDSTSQIWFQENVGQFEQGVRYGFKTQFGSMLVYDDHIRIMSNQIDPVTGVVGIHTVDITFNGSSPWQIVPGGESGVLGSFQQADGTTLTPHIFKEMTLRNVYGGVDLRLYSANQGVLEFDWLVAHAQDYSQIRMQFTGQDGIVFNADGSATLDLRYQDLTLKMPEVYQVIDGQKHLLGASMVAGEKAGEMRYSLTGDIVADQPLVIDPNVAWSTYFDLNDSSSSNAFDSYLFAIQTNSAGTYCAGWVKEIITNGSYGNYMQVNAGFSQGTVINQNYIYRLNTTGTGITAWTSTGIVGSSNSSSSTNPATDLELFPDGRVLVAYRDSTIQIYSANLATQSYTGKPVAISTINSLAIVNNSTFYVGGIIGAANAGLIPGGSGLDDTFAGTSEGVIIRYTLNGLGVPVSDWATYVGGANAENFTAITMTPDMSKLVFAVHSVEQGTTLLADAYPTLVNAVDSTPDTVAGRTEILTGVIADQALKPAAFSVFSLLGGTGNEGTTGSGSAAVVVAASNTGYWVGGNTASTDLPGTAGGAQAANGGGTNDAFASFIPINGSAGVGFQSTYLGGAGNEIVGGIAYDPVRDRLFLFGTTTGSFPTLDTTPTSQFYSGTFGGGTYDIFIATFDGALLTKDYATYIGGSSNDYLGDTGVLLGTGHVTYSAATQAVYLATSVHSTLPANIIGPSIPGYDLTKNNGGNDVHVIFAFNIGIFDHGDAPASYEAGTPAAEATSPFIRIGATVDAEVVALSGATATGDDLSNTGAANDEDGVSSLAYLFNTDTTYSVTVSVLNNTGAVKTLQGWIDFNGDGIFSATERASFDVTASASAQNVTLNWASLPGIIAGQSYLRLRFSETMLADNGATTIDERSIGQNPNSAGHGEVEDYALTVHTLSTLSGFVYNDANNDGTKQGGEAGIGGITITLTGTNDLGALVSLTTTTNVITGAYSFAGLRPSNGSGYTITEGAVGGGLLDGRDTIGTQGGTAGNDTFNVVLAPSVTGTANNFGELSPSSLSGFVYSDLSNFGTKDSFETGIPGVTITLTGTDDLGAAVSLTTTTAAGTGAYSFANLRPSSAGGYTITESATPAGFTDGLDSIGTQGGTTGNDVLSAIVLASGTTGTANNFGESPNFGLTKTLVTTSDAGTTGSNVAVGETATFRLVVTIPAGTFGNFQIQDALPAGYQYVNGSALVSLVSSAGQLTSSTLSGAGLAQTSVGTPTFVLPDAAVSDNTTTNSDAYVSGTDVFFKLGTLTNAETTAAVESVVIQFQAVVVNEAGNQAATNLSNTFGVLLDKDGVGGPDSHGGSSAPVVTPVVEPVLGVTKVLGTVGTDAGDVVTYTITITNAAGNNATAYDINVTDLLDTDILLNNVTLGSGIVVSGATVGSNSSTTGNLNLVLNSLAAGASATITLNATVVAGASAGNTVSNGTTITWTSSSGANANERTGAGGINDYTASANSANFVLARPTVDKLTPADTTYSVGETITYDILVTLPEGITSSLAITDNLPAGLDYVSVAVQTAAGGVLANAFNGTVSGAPTVSNVGNSYTFTFGNTTTANDNVGTNNSFLVRVTARVANVVGNQNAVVLTNTATLAYNDGTNGASVVNDPTPNVNITVVEPALTLGKTVVGASSGFDAGDTVQYQIVITNTGTATANEVTLSDALPAGLLVTTINSTTPAGGASVDTVTGGTGSATLTGEYTIPVGGSITILYTATLQSSVTPNTNFTNTATVTFSSVDGTALGQGTATGERIGIAPNIQGDSSLNDYRLQSSATVSTGGVLAVAKGVNNATPSIGDVLTYTVTLTLNEGTTNGITVTDTLPASGDLQFVVGSAAVSFGTGGSSISGSTVPVVSGGNGNVLTFNLGTAVVPAGAGANTVVLTYQVRVQNVATNQAGDMETNSAHVVATGLTPPPDGTTTVTLHEPNVTFSKTPSVSSGVDAGDVITYTIVLTNPGGATGATAFDSLLTDTMPADLRVTGITGSVLTGGATTDSAAAITGGGTGLTGQYDIPVGATVTITYTATVQATFPPNGSLTNGAVLTWTSVNGGNSTAPDANERFGAAGSIFGDGSLNDYRRTTSATTTGAGATFSKTLFATSDANTAGSNVTFGEQLTYALIVTLPEGTTSGFSVLDTLPPGLRFVSATIATTTGAGNPLTSNFNGTVPAPTITGGAADGDDVNFSFGAITVNGDNVTTNNTFAIMVTAVVTDVPGNSGVAPQTVLPNSATFSGTGVPPVTPPAVNVTTTEPRLQITKGVDDTTADLGQTLTYTLTIAHTASSTATAYDLIIRDAIPSGFTLNTGSISIAGGTLATDTSTASQLALTIDQFDVGGTITITYTATVGTGAALGGTDQDNNVRLFWDTTAADTGSNAALTGVADGDDDRDFGATLGYTEAPTPAPDDLAQDTVRVTVNSNTLSGFVYLDADSSGTRNGVESGLGVGVNVTISGTTFFGVAFSQTVTADPTTGAYTFTNVPRSDATGYTITETQPGAFVDGVETVGTLYGGTKSDALGSDTMANIVVPIGSGAATGYNFGELQGSSLGGFTYVDLNENGTREAGEDGLGTAIPVTLTGTDVFGQAVSLSGSSDPVTGVYSFAGLRPSDGAGYTITEDDSAVVPSSFFDGAEQVGSLSGTVTGTGPKFDAINVSVAQNQTGTNYNFGEIQPLSLSGNVYADLNNDGNFDAFERGVPGVTITLTGRNDLGATVNITVTTNASGGYTFANVRPSDATGYTITETQPADYADGQDTLGTPGGDASVNDTFSAIVLSTVRGANYNFGEQPVFTLTKSLASTSLASTIGSNVAVGETATFRLVITVPVGSLTNFQVQDFLPSGYQYVNGSARAGLVSSAGQLTSSTLGGAGLALTSVTTPTFVLPDAAVSDNVASNSDGYASGTDVFFKLGTLVNTDTTAAVEAVVIEFDAVVVNEAANVAGRTLANNFGVLYDADGTGDPDPNPTPSMTVNTTVVSPVLNFAKTASTAGPVNAGDTITYTLTITNPGGANSSTAFDALVTDTMPADILVTSITSVVTSGGVTTDSAVAITGGGAGLSGQFDIPVGGTVTITYVGTVQVSAPTGVAETNNAEVTWTSLDGSNSLTPDAGERFGAAGTLFGDSNLNNFRNVDSQTVTVATATFGKQFFGTSDAGTPGSSVAIGEDVTYALVVTVPAGTAPSLGVIDSLPAGLQFISSSIVTTAAASGGLLTADFNGTVPAPVVTGGASDGDDVNFNFGPIVANADGVAGNNTFLILVTARVTNAGGNSGTSGSQTVLPNTATFDIPGDGVPPTFTPPVNVTVVEPTLAIAKTFSVPSADAGDTVNVTIVVNNTGTGPAYDVAVSDVVDVAKFGNITALTTPAGFIFNNAAGTVTYTGGTIAGGGSATFIFSVKLADAVQPSEILSNTASATASSQPGVVPGERDFGPVQNTATLDVPAVFNLTKGIVSPGGGAVQIGDVITYQVNVTVIEGTTQNVVLTDTLPAGMSYVAGSAVVSNANGMTVNGFSAVPGGGNVLTISTTSIVNPGAVDSAATDSGTFTITYQAVVNDVAGNAAGTLLTNNLTGTGTGVPPSTPPPVSTTVTEPQLRVTKAVNDSTPDLGQTVHFTLTIQNLAVANGATAFDILVRDLLPAGLGGLANISVNGANIDANNSTGSLLDLKLDQLALGATATVDFDAVVSTVATFAGANIDNNARIYWDTQAGESPNTVLTGAPDGDTDRDYGATGADEVFNLDTQDAQDTERFTVNGSALTGFVYGDADASGTFSGGDVPLVGETVTLTGQTIFGENISITATTVAGGVYSFANLAPGTYTLTETQPAGYLDAAETVGTNFGGIVSAAPGSNTISSLTITAGNSSGAGYNFGEVLASSLSGTVYSDANNDGIVDGTETLLDGVPVQLTGTDYLGQSVSISGITSGGAYSFTNLRPGTYTITETQPGAFLDGKETAGSQGSGAVNNLADSNTISNIVLAQNVSGAGNNFGELVPATISGTVFQDFNLDGVMNGPDSGLNGVTVTLTGTDDRGGSVTLPLTTNGSGVYSFGNLRPGTYVVTETQPAGYGDGIDTAGNVSGVNSANDVISGITVGSGTNAGGNTFAEIFPFEPLKSIVSTSNPGTAGSNLSIGEVARFRIIVSLPDGTLPSLVLQDQLPAGLVFLDDGTAAVSLVSQSGNAVTSSTLAGPGIGGTSTSTAPTFLLPDSAISSSLTADVDAYGSGTDVYFKLGNITNSETNVAGGEYAVIEFNARVENIPANRIGVPLDNTFRVLFDLNDDGTPDVPLTEIVSAPAKAVVAEPILYIDKELTGGSAVPRQGDILTFTVTIGHATGSDATAWEAIFSDTLPKGLDFQGISTSASGGAVITLAATADANGKLSGQFDIPVGGKITITYTVKVNVKPGSGTSLVNGADVTWTSLPGESPVERHAGDSLYGGGGLHDSEVRDLVRVTPIQFAFDSFNNFAAPPRLGAADFGTQGIDVWRQPLLPLAPIYSGAADPGSTLVLTLYNANGENIGSQSVIVDAGGNWMVNFPSSTIRDYPNSVEVSQTSAFYSLSDPHGHNMRTYFSPALSAGHFFSEELRQLSEGSRAPLLGDIGLWNPISLGTVKYGGELLSAIGAPGGY